MYSPCRAKGAVFNFVPMGGMIENRQRASIARQTRAHKVTGESKKENGPEGDYLIGLAYKQIIEICFGGWAAAHKDAHI